MYGEARVPLIVEYSEETTFHGLKYIFRTKQSIFERLFWIVILTSLIFVLGYFVFTNVSRFVQYPLKIQDNTHSSHVFEIPFPAVTICPANKIQHANFSDSAAIIEHFMQYVNGSENDAWNSGYGAKLIMATQVCRKTFSDFLPKMIKLLSNRTSLNFTTPTELNLFMVNSINALSPALEESLSLCQFSNFYNTELADDLTFENVIKLFTEVLTNEGLCFTFNTISDVMRSKVNRHYPFYIVSNFFRDGWDPETGYSKHKAFPFKGIVREKNELNGLSLQLSSSLSGRTDICFPSELGYKVILHSPSAYPHSFEKFISLEYGKDYTIAVKPETISTADNLRSISPEVRQCYFNDERQLKYYTFYNENNCKLECYANSMLKMFGGFPFWAPRDRGLTITVLKSHNYGWNVPNYFGSVHAYNEIYKNSIDINSTLVTDCNCLPECNSIRYDYEIIDTNIEMLEINRIENSNNISFTKLEIVYQQPTFIGKQRVEEYRFSSLVSDFGGLLGLFMGGSIISIFEIIYFLVIRNFCRAK